LSVRIKPSLKTINTSREVVVKGYINTGFISDALHIALPVSIAERLDQWLIPSRKQLLYQSKLVVELPRPM